MGDDLVDADKAMCTEIPWLLLSSVATFERKENERISWWWWTTFFLQCLVVVVVYASRIRNDEERERERRKKNGGRM